VIGLSRLPSRDSRAAERARLHSGPLCRGIMDWRNASALQFCAVNRCVKGGDALPWPTRCRGAQDCYFSWETWHVQFSAATGARPIVSEGLHAQKAPEHPPFDA
jgi:hypothetical protein